MLKCWAALWLNHPQARMQQTRPPLYQEETCSRLRLWLHSWPVRTVACKPGLPQSHNVCVGPRQERKRSGQRRPRSESLQQAFAAAGSPRHPQLRLWQTPRLLLRMGLRLLQGRMPAAGLQDSRCACHCVNPRTLFPSLRSVHARAGMLLSDNPAMLQVAGPACKCPAAAQQPLPVPDDMPLELIPQSDSRGRLSYTVHVGEGDQRVSVEVLLKAKAFRTKRPKVAHVSWTQHESKQAAWAACKAAALQ